MKKKNPVSLDKHPQGTVNPLSQESQENISTHPKNTWSATNTVLLYGRKRVPSLSISVCVGNDKRVATPGLQIQSLLCAGAGSGPQRLRIPPDKPNSLSTKHGQGMLVHLGAASSTTYLLFHRVSQALASHGPEQNTTDVPGAQTNVTTVQQRKGLSRTENQIIPVSLQETNANCLQRWLLKRNNFVFQTESKMAVFWVVPLCNLVGYRRFRGACPKTAKYTTYKLYVLQKTNNVPSTRNISCQI